MHYLRFIFFLLPMLWPGQPFCKEKINQLLEDLHKYPHFDTARVNLLNQIGYEYWIVDPNESELYGTQALNLSRQLDYRPGIAFAGRVIGVAHWARGNYNPALEFLSQALDSYRDLADRLGEANCLLNIGLVYGDQGIDDKALEYFERALEDFESLGESGRIATTYTKIGSIYANQKKLDDALPYFERALAIHQENAFSYGIAEVHNRMGILNLEAEKFDEAIRHFTHSLEVGNSIEDKHGITSNKLYLARVYLRLGNYKSAESNLHDALENATELDIRKFKKEIFWELKNLALRRGETDKALEYFEQYDQVRESLFNEELTSTIAQLESRMLIKQKENELELQKAQIEFLEKRNRLNKFLRIALGILVISLLLGGFFLFRSQKFKIRNNRLKQLELEKQIAFKNSELASYAIHFVQKNELLEAVKSEISALRGGQEIGIDRQLQHLEHQIDESFQIDREWKEFERRFEELHSKFFSGLKKRFPDLSTNDLRLCALLRLNLTIKEMASILHISPDSVKTARYRLRKKLGLQHEETLLDFLLKIDKENLADQG